MLSHEATTSPANRTRWDRLLPAAVLFVALAARLMLLGSKSLWADEAYAAGLAGLPFLEAVRLFPGGTPHPGGGMAIIWLSTRLFGPGESGLRALIAVISASASVPLFLFLKRRSGSWGAACAALCWALCPWSVSLGQEAWIYGPMAALSIWAIHLADEAWRGSQNALLGFVAVSSTGVWVQLIFALSVGAALGLYFTIPPAERVARTKPILAVTAIFALSFPVLLALPAELAERSSRLTRSGDSGLDFVRLVHRAPSILARFLSGGLLPESLAEIVHVPRYLAALAAGAAVQLFALASCLTGRRVSRADILWLAALLFVPLLLFLVDDPTARQFPLGWLATAIMIAIASDGRRWFGLLSVAVCALLLSGYYGTRAFPYHRSDWRAATAQVEEASSQGDVVILTGARSMTQAWNFYSHSDLEVVDATGGNPYLPDAAAPGKLDPVSLADSLSASGRRVWIVMDYWGGPSLVDLFPNGDLLPGVPGSVMQVMLIERTHTD